MKLEFYFFKTFKMEFGITPKFILKAVKNKRLNSFKDELWYYLIIKSLKGNFNCNLQFKLTKYFKKQFYSP